ncbi:MAG: Cys-tRNA(Pro) deacylase [Christensenellaceae bacterium]
MDKTNVMRLLDAAKIEYVPHEYDSEATDGQTVARLLGQEEDAVFKTLVTTSGKEYFVFVVPVNSTLQTKKAAKAVGVKAIEMIKQRELLPLTGYVHGGCSPIGMKKPFRTVINDTAQLFDTICVSAGKRGYQVELSPVALAEYVGAEFEDIIE